LNLFLKQIFERRETYQLVSFSNWIVWANTSTGNVIRQKLNHIVTLWPPPAIMINS